MEKLDDDMKNLFYSVGISDNDQVDKETIDFIYDFVEKNGGIEQVKKEMMIRPPPPPPPVTPAQQRSLPLERSKTERKAASSGPLKELNHSNIQVTLPLSEYTSNIAIIRISR